MKRIDITSTAIEKGIDTVKLFLEKLIGPSIEETGLLLKDKIMFWRFKNQVKMINKAKIYCDKNNISPKNIPIKILSPILEYASLEGDDELQDKWAILLSNLVDSKQNIENHVFPHLLSQLSKKEFNTIEAHVNQTIKIRNILKQDYERISLENENEKKLLNAKIQKLEEALKAIKDKKDYEKEMKINVELMGLQNKYWILEKEQDQIILKINEPPSINSNNLENFEIANLTRLGLIKVITMKSVYINNAELPLDREDDTVSLRDLDIGIEDDYEKIIITELGELFIGVCTENSNTPNNA